MKRLPPLSAIEAFVQTARPGSVKAAAEALALSSPALTRRIQALERHVGHPCSSGATRRSCSTMPASGCSPRSGRRSTRSALAMERGTGNGGLMRLKLSVLPLFASYQLMPRLREAAGAPSRPSISTSTPAPRPRPARRGLDAAITLAREVDAPLYARGSAPTRWSRSARAAGRGARARCAEPSSWPRRRCCSTATCPTRSTTGARRSGFPDLEPAAIDHFDSGQLILDAAAQGLGIAFMFEMHLEGAHDPRLARLFDVSVESPYAYWFACRRSALSRRPVRLFHDWLIEELATPWRRTGERTATAMFRRVGP